MSSPDQSLSAVGSLLSDSYGFRSPFQWVRSRPTVADLFKPGQRCGIYVFRFANDQYYVGQAVDVTRRFVQHTKNHNDIQEMAFCCVPNERLNEVEQKLIAHLESKRLSLRNISLTSFPKGKSDLDLIVPADAQEDWLNRNITHRLQAHFIDHPDLQAKYAARFHKLEARARFSQDICAFLRRYFERCVLDPAQTELSFWSLTALPSESLYADDIAMCRLNMFWCEVLTIWGNSYNGAIYYSIRLAKSKVTKAHLRRLKLVSLRIDPRYYPRGGADQLSIQVKGIDDALAVLDDENVVVAAKTFNLRQMQKGATVYGRYHCLDFAQHILAPHHNRVNARCALTVGSAK